MGHSHHSIMTILKNSLELQAMSKTVLVSDIEHCYGLKGRVTFFLYIFIQWAPRVPMDKAKPRPLLYTEHITGVGINDPYRSPTACYRVCGFYDKRAATGIKGNKWTLRGIFKDGRETYKQEQVLNHMRTVLHIGTFSETWVQCWFFHKAVIEWNSITNGSLIPVILSIRSTQDNKWALWQSRKTRSELLSLEMLTHPSCPACSFQMSPCRAARCSNHSRLHHSQPAGIIAQLQYRVSFDLRLWMQTVCVWLYFFFLYELHDV